MSARTAAQTLFRRFRAGAPHFALIGEKGKRPVGFITLDNLLGAMVGEIRDEFRLNENDWLRQPDGTLSQTDAGVSTLTLTASNLPPGAMFDPVTQLLSWKPGYNDSGLHQVTFTATDDGDNPGVPPTTIRTTTTNVHNVQLTPLLPLLDHQTPHTRTEGRGTQGRRDRGQGRGRHRRLQRYRAGHGATVCR